MVRSLPRLASRRVLAVALVAAVAPVTVLAQQPTLQDPLLDHMVGAWVLTGTIAKQPTTHDVEARWVLNHQFIQVHEVSRERDPKDRTKAQYEALVLIGWDEKQKQY